MSSITRAFWCGLVLATAALLTTAAGCGKKDADKVTDQAKKKPHKEHPEKGPHGGALGEAGDETYHIEFVPDHEKQEARVWVLDGEADKLVPIDAKTELKLTITNVTPNATIDLKAEPEKTDPKGKSSCFVGNHKALGKEMEFKGVVSGKIEGAAYSFKFTEKPHKHKDKK